MRIFKTLFKSVQYTPALTPVASFTVCTDKTAAFKHIIRLAKDLGAKIIAEGIGLDSELEVCKEIGCEFVQGYLIQRPSCDVHDIKTFYPAGVKVA